MTVREAIHAEGLFRTALVEGRHAGTRLRYSFEDPAFVDEERCAAPQAEIAETPALAEIVVSGQRS